MPDFRITVLISGGGTTLKNLIDKRRSGDLDAKIVRVISSNPSAGGIRFASRQRIPVNVLQRNNFASVQAYSDAVFECLRESECELVVMGGFLIHILVPADFQNRIINIHPSLIPSFCGKGFYGRRVHQAVLDFGCKVTGCTIHMVDDEYDHGKIVSQRAVEVRNDDCAKSLGERVFAAECEEYPRAINDLAKKRLA